jgi:hypothetical protein
LTPVLVFALVITVPVMALPVKSLTVVERTLTQDQGAWLVTYRLRYQGASELAVKPTEIGLKVEGWLSNSRVSSHTIPRLCTVVVSGTSYLSGMGDVLTGAYEEQRCRERVVVQIRNESPSGSVSGSSRPFRPIPAPLHSTAGWSAQDELQPYLVVAPGTTIRVRLWIEHLHFLYGDYDPLLGVRSLELTLDAATLRDVLPLDTEQYIAQPKYIWPAPPEDRRDARQFLSAPDSLHLEAHIPGNQSYRFPERPVRYGTMMRLRFAYFVAAGTEGECRVQIMQYKDTPTSWKALSEGWITQCLSTVGRWVRVEKVFRTESEANLLALDFRISGSEVGEMWIDDVSLEPVGQLSAIRNP